MNTFKIYAGLWIPFDFEKLPNKKVLVKKASNYNSVVEFGGFDLTELNKEDFVDDYIDFCKHRGFPLTDEEIERERKYYQDLYKDEVEYHSNVVYALLKLVFTDIEKKLLKSKKDIDIINELKNTIVNYDEFIEWLKTLPHLKLENISKKDYEKFLKYYKKYHDK